MLHPSAKDHKKEIVCMIASERLELCVTSSLDKTLRIWDEDNFLRKIIDLNVCARPIQFSSVVGDIIFSAGRHLYKIPSDSYLPQKYKTKIVSNDLYDVEEFMNPSWYEGYRPYEGIINIESLLNAKSTIPLLSIDINSENPRIDVLIMKQICALYDYRDEDIFRIKDHMSEFKQLTGNRELMVKDEWTKYVTELSQNLKRILFEPFKYNLRSIFKTERQKQNDYNENAIFYLRFGYSLDELEEVEDVQELLNNMKLPLHGFLPNSVLYKKKEEKKLITPSIHTTKKITTRYKYPTEFYPKEKSIIRASTLMSQLEMDIGSDINLVNQ